MEKRPAEIDAELLDLSTVDVATLRSVPLADIEAAIERVRERVTDAKGSITGYSGSFSGRMRPSAPGSDGET